jgi:ubiquinone biosynthesis protein UbiJ
MTYRASEVDRIVTEAMAAGERASAGRDRTITERIDNLAEAVACLAERIEELEMD